MDTPVAHSETTAGPRLAY